MGAILQLHAGSRQNVELQKLINGHWTFTGANLDCRSLSFFFVVVGFLVVMLRIDLRKLMVS